MSQETHREQLLRIIEDAALNVAARPVNRRGPYVITDADIQPIAAEIRAGRRTEMTKQYDEDIMKAAREAFVSVLTDSSKWMAQAIMDGFGDGSGEVQAAAAALQAERDRWKTERDNLSFELGDFSAKIGALVKGGDTPDEIAALAKAEITRLKADIDTANARADQMGAVFIKIAKAFDALEWEGFLNGRDDLNAAIIEAYKLNEGNRDDQEI